MATAFAHLSGCFASPLLKADRVWFEYGVAEAAAGSDLQRNNNRLTAWPPQYEGGNMIFAYLIGLFCSGLEPRGID